MTTIVTLSLDSDWQAWREYTGPGVVHDERRYDITLADWQADESEPGWEMVFERHFYLEPLDACARYLLHVGELPGATAVYFVGEQPIGGGRKAPLVLDVTEYVVLEDNRLKLKVDLGTIELGKRFGGVRLDAIPCE